MHVVCDKSLTQLWRFLACELRSDEHQSLESLISDNEGDLASPLKTRRFVESDGRTKVSGCIEHRPKTSTVRFIDGCAQERASNPCSSNFWRYEHASDNGQAFLFHSGALNGTFHGDRKTLRVNSCVTHDLRTELGHPCSQLVGRCEKVLDVDDPERWVAIGVSNELRKLQ